MKSPLVYGAWTSGIVLLFYLIATLISFAISRELVGGLDTTIASIAIQVIGWGLGVTALVTVWRWLQTFFRKTG